MSLIGGFNMEVHTASWSIKQLKTMMINGTILFDYPIQRSGEQWNLKQKSDLIHSCIIGLPVPPLYFLRHYEQRETDKKPVPIRHVLDGKQRLTTILSYVLDGEETEGENGEKQVHKGFALNHYEPLFIDGQEYDVSGKTFSELDEEVKDALLGKNIPNYTFDQDLTTDDEIELLFYRMNASKPLTIHQKSKSLIGIRFSTLLNDVSNHSTIMQLSNFPTGQLKDNKHQAAILQTMMIFEGFAFKNFSAKETSRYAETIKNDFENKVKTLEKVEKALDYLNECFVSKEKVLLKAVSFPMTVSLAYIAACDNVEPDMFGLWAQAFNDALEGKETNNPTNYLDYTGTGSTDLVKVNGRINEMERHFNAYMDLLNSPVA